MEVSPVSTREAISKAGVSGGDSMGTSGMPSIDRLERLDVSAFSGPHLDRPGTWAVAFLATWCGYCRSFAPQFASLANGRVHLATADLSHDEDPLWDLLGIEFVPTVIVFRDGAPVQRFDARPAEGLGPADLERMRTVLSNA